MKPVKTKCAASENRSEQLKTEVFSNSCDENLIKSETVGEKCEVGSTQVVPCSDVTEQTINGQLMLDIHSDVKVENSETAQSETRDEVKSKEVEEVKYRSEGEISSSELEDELQPSNCLRNSGDSFSSKVPPCTTGRHAEPLDSKDLNRIVNVHDTGKFTDGHQAVTDRGLQQDDKDVYINPQDEQQTHVEVEDKKSGLFGLQKCSETVTHSDAQGTTSENNNIDDVENTVATPPEPTEPVLPPVVEKPKPKKKVIVPLSRN